MTYKTIHRLNIEQHEPQKMTPEVNSCDSGDSEEQVVLSTLLN